MEDGAMLRRCCILACIAEGPPAAGDEVGRKLEPSPLLEERADDGIRLAVAAADEFPGCLLPTDKYICSYF